MLPANFADDEVFQERFRREARAAAGLDEPHVVPIYDSGEIEGRLFVSMRLIRGLDLQELLDAGPLPPARVVGIIEQVAAALHAAHQVDLVHRDVTYYHQDRVVRLAAGSNVQTDLPFTGLRGPHGVAVDGSGAVYVADSGNKRVVKLAAGSSAQTVLPFTGLSQPYGVAVDAGGAVYVANFTSDVLVVKLSQR